MPIMSPKHSFKIGDRACVNYRSYSNFDSLRKRVGIVIDIDDPEGYITVEFNDEYTRAVLSNPEMYGQQDVLTDYYESFDRALS